MDTLLIFFAIPIAVIIVSIALQKILKCPPLVAAIIFVIFLVIAFAISNLNFLVAGIAYSILGFITASIVCLICRFLRNNCDRSNNCWNCCSYNNCRNRRNSGYRNCDNENNGNNELLTINSSCSNNNNGNLLTISSNGCNSGTFILSEDGNLVNNSCNCSDTGRVSARINVIPNNNTNGRTGCVCGSYRRR